MQLNILGFTSESFVDGTGIRCVIWCAGCSHKCQGCHNPESWNPKNGQLTDIGFLIGLMEQTSWVDGISISGGEPLDQWPAVKELIIRFKDWFPDKDVWLFSGYTYDELMEWKDNPLEFLLIDVFKLGRFENDKLVQNKFYGSGNQVLMKRIEGMKFKTE